MEKKINELSFLFLDEAIDPANMGSREGDNRFLLEEGPFKQLAALLESFEGFVPIGVCMDEAYVKDYGNKYRPIVLENNNGERCWVHIPYDTWKEYLSLGIGV